MGSFAAIDIFCGVGGLTHGLVKSGIPVVAGIDTDDTCKYAFEKNNNAIFLNKDIREVNVEDLDDLYGNVKTKILVGCAPCQCFSKHTQKNRNRKKDRKWKLLYSFARLVTAVKPQIVSMENVPGLARQDIFGEFVDELKQLKYRVFYDVVNCADYGVPQQRQRLVLLASKSGLIELIKPTHRPERYRTVRSAIGNLPRIAAGESDAKDRLHQACSLSPTNLRRIRASRPGGTWRDWDKKLVAECHKRGTGKTYPSVYGRMLWDEPAPTITTQFYGFGNGRFGHPDQDRAISLREGALLQTFPKYYDFIDPNLDMSLKRMGTHVGNAVPVRLGVVIGRSILKHLEENNG